MEEGQSFTALDVPPTPGVETGGPPAQDGATESIATKPAVEDVVSGAGGNRSHQRQALPGKASMRSHLDRKQYRRRRMYKRAWKTIMTVIEDSSDGMESSSEDSIESDDLVGSSDDEKRPRRTQKINEIVAGIMGVQPGEKGSTEATIGEAIGPESESKPFGSLAGTGVSTQKAIFRVELYTYAKHGRKRKPELKDVIEKAVSIVTEKEAQPLLGKTQSAPFAITNVYAIQQHATAQKLDGQNIKFQYHLGEYIVIHSREIREAFQKVVSYYPMQSSYEEPLLLSQPYCLYVHHMDLLRRYEPASVAGRENGESDHLTLFLDTMQQHLGSELSAEQARHDRRTCTFQWVWMLFQPGTIVYKRSGSSILAFHVHEHNAGSNPPLLHLGDTKYEPHEVSSLDELDAGRTERPLKVTTWFLEYNGQYLGRKRREFQIMPFKGEMSIESLLIFPKQYLKVDHEICPNSSVEEYLIARGKKYCRLMNRSYQNYQGRSARHWHSGAFSASVESNNVMDLVTMTLGEITGRIVVDTKYYYDAIRVTRPDNMDSEPEAFGGRIESIPLAQNISAYTSQWKPKSPDEASRLPDEQYIVCANTVYAFVLKTRTWAQLDIHGIEEPDFHAQLIESLVLKPEARFLIQALARRYTAVEPNDDQRRSADFVMNKGEGHIFLLHGKPGVGKTSTAECVAEMTKRPLLSLTCGDLGLSPIEVEKQLTKWMKLAAHWGAILLLDEADIYLESRIAQDLRRNSLVSIFLRALEYYPGIMFLTTNRVGTFDDGFISRIHVVIHYPDFTDDERNKIWNTFFDRLERENETIQVSQRTLEYVQTDSTLKSLKWNGREIRNAFNTAVALAEFEDERTSKGKITVMPSHLEQVVKMSKSFHEYMKSTLGMDQARRAKIHRVRDDDYGVITD